MLTRDDVIRMASEVGALRYTNRHLKDEPSHAFAIGMLERFAAAAYSAGAAAERDAFAQDRIDAARYRVWRETYTAPDGEPCTELDISIGDAWTADALDAVLDAEIRQRITDPLAPGCVPPGAGAGCQAPCRCGPDGCADSACPGRTA